MIDFVAFLGRVNPDLPPQGWWIIAGVFVVLTLAAIIDMMKGIIPDPLIFIGTVFYVGAVGFSVDWPVGARHLAIGMVAAALIWAINEVWFRLFKHDALGLGDAKWTMLAVACFGWQAGLLAWGTGAILGTVWIGGMKLLRRPMRHVHFAPFLWVGLTLGVVLLHGV